MKILFVSPNRPDTFWNLKHVLKCISKKATLPPLGLLTVAGMLPQNWEKKLVDMTVEKLTDKDILWADYVFIGAMYIQKDSALEIARRCKQLGVKTFGGGPIFRRGQVQYEDIDHVLYGEAENTIAQVIDDIENGCPKPYYFCDKWADLTETPRPLWSLLKKKNYGSMSIQYSRGCPFGCDFCDVTELFGNRMRLKKSTQMISELDALYDIGWKGAVFLVDDNFIGNKNELKKEVLPAMIEWSRSHKHPFNFNTQVSINVADDEELMEMLSDAGFDTVFIGIESSNEESLLECNKKQNANRNLVHCVKKIQRFGLQVQAGFILGFDSDQPSIFEKMADFIQTSGIATAMVGLLNAPRGTELYKRLKAEGRIIKDSTGDNTDYSLNFVPKMDSDLLVKGYASVVKTIYEPKNYYKTVMTLLENYQPPKDKPPLRLSDLRTLLKAAWKIGVLAKGRVYYWKLMLWTLFKCRKNFHLAVVHAIYGFHFRKVLTQ
jgi:radical SAM superfamily enzyme YgiQ (UPF0313 family)